MPFLNSTLLAITLLIAIIALILSPTTLHESRSFGCLIAAPPSYVQACLLDYDTVRSWQAEGLDSIDALRVVGDGTKVSKKSNDNNNKNNNTTSLTTTQTDLETQSPFLLLPPGTTLHLHNPTNPLPSPRLATITHSTASLLTFQTTRSWLDSLTHRYTITSSGVPGYETRFEYAQHWMGSVVGKVMRGYGLLPGFFGEGLESGWARDRGTPLKEMVEGKWRAEKEKRDA